MGIRLILDPYYHFGDMMLRSKVYLTREQSHRIDEIAIAEGTSGISLMENAGRACVSKLIDHGCKSAVICCGTGNNGGDGFVIARRLAIEGVPTKILLCGNGNRISGDALTNFNIARDLDLAIVTVSEDWDDICLTKEVGMIASEPVDWIVDCMLGTGAFGDPRPPMDRIIRAANSNKAHRLAVDVPSGLDCQTGDSGDPTFAADLTCTFVAKKTGFQTDNAKKYLGQTQVVSIGISMELVERVLREQE